MDGMVNKKKRTVTLIIIFILLIVIIILTLFIIRKLKKTDTLISVKILVKSCKNRVIGERIRMVYVRQNQDIIICSMMIIRCLP